MITLQAVLHQLDNCDSHPGYEEVPAGNYGLKYNRETSCLVHSFLRKRSVVFLRAPSSTPCGGLVDLEGGSEWNFRPGNKLP